jgi:hypothetical protein
MEQGSVDAAVMLDPAVTLLQGKNKDLKILSDTRTQKDTLDVFGGEYPGGALYTKSAWIAAHPKETQALTNAILATLKWIHSHTPEEIMAKMPDGLVGADKALYLAALKNTIPMYSTTGKMDPKGARPCSTCSANRRRRSRTPRSICRRPTPTNSLRRRRAPPAPSSLRQMRQDERMRRGPVSPPHRCLG